MQRITTTQAAALTAKIYDLIISSPDSDMGDMGDAHEAAESLVYEWAEENNIEITQ